MPMLFLDATLEDAPIIFANKSFLRLTGCDRSEVLGQNLISLLMEKGDAATTAELEGILKDNTPVDYEARIRRKDYSPVWVSIFASPVYNIDGKPMQYFVSMVDLTKHKESERQLRISEQRFRMAASAAGLGVIDIDLVVGTLEWSDSLREIIGIATDIKPSIDAYEAIIHPDDRAAALLNYAEYIKGEKPISNNIYRVIRPIDNQVRWVVGKREVVLGPSGEPLRVVVTIEDITEDKLAQERITRAATHDMVTGLPNRSLFRSELESAIARDPTATGGLSLMLVDLDHFKDINDTLGHQSGDAALVGFAHRLSAMLSPGLLVARLGGDEFAIILPGTGKIHAATLASDLLVQLRPPFSLGERAVDIRASIGVSTYPLDGQSYSALLHSADLALYAAKEAGGGTVRAFTSDLRVPRQRQLSMIRNARAALGRGWIEPFYQPKIVLASGRVAGFEALLRLRHPRAGVQSPAKIASAFDDGHLAPLLGAAMTEAVAADLRVWIDRGLAVGRIAINASAVEIRDPDFAGRLLARLSGHDIPADSVELEITETALLDDLGGSVAASLQELRASGITVALDDFGTGFSSLSHLRDFPVDTIKIDRSFVAQIEQSERSRAIVAAVLQLGDGLGMTTVGEGVETEEQAEFLRQHGCMLAQGFLYSPAVEGSQVESLLGGLDH